MAKGEPGKGTCVLLSLRLLNAAARTNGRFGNMFSAGLMAEANMLDLISEGLLP